MTMLRVTFLGTRNFAWEGREMAWKDLARLPNLCIDLWIMMAPAPGPILCHSYDGTKCVLQDLGRNI